MRHPRNFVPDRCYHLISRIANRAFYLGEDERTRFVARMWRADGKGVTWYNTNRMLNPNDEFYHPEVTGMKTGSTSAAGNCIIVSFDHAGKEMIAVILGAPSDEARYEAAEALMAALQ